MAGELDRAIENLRKTLLDLKNTQASLLVRVDKLEQKVKDLS